MSVEANAAKPINPNMLMCTKNTPAHIAMVSNDVLLDMREATALPPSVFLNDPPSQSTNKNIVFDRPQYPGDHRIGSSWVRHEPTYQTRKFRQGPVCDQRSITVESSPDKMIVTVKKGVKLI